MKSLIKICLLSLLLIAVHTTVVQNSDTCRACNCQLSNIQALTQLVKTTIKEYLIDESKIGLFGITANSTVLSLTNITKYTSTLAAVINDIVIDSISRTVPSLPDTGANHLLAYWPRYHDIHGNNVGALFFNLPGIFPCLLGARHVLHLPCFPVTADEDGFFNGAAILQAVDGGNHFRIFSCSSPLVLTYGLAFQGCPEINTTCYPTFAQTSVACLLPREYCG